MTQEPVASRAIFPSEYGQRGGAEDELMPWSYVEEKLQKALNYWLSTVSAEGRPHVRPVDGVWVQGALCFGGSPEARWVRNLERGSPVTLNLGSEEEAIILEGAAELITDATHPLGTVSAVASKEKYPQYYTGEAADAEPEFQPFWCFRPARAYYWALKGFPNRATRWTF